MIVDDFQRALEAVSSPDAQNKIDNFENLLSGMKLIYDKLMTVLRNKGVREIEALEKPFDPVYHEAVMQSPSENHEPGTVIEVAQPGYMLGEKVIRHSKVIVSS